MIDPRPNWFLESVRGLVTIAGWGVLFYKLHRPPTKVRRAAMLVSFPVFYVLWRYFVYNDFTFVEMYPPVFYSFSWALGILFFALLTGGGRSSLFTAIYYIVSEQIVDVTRMCAVGWIRGGWFEPFSLERYTQAILHYLFILGWTVWFYRIMKEQRRNLPPRVWVINLVPPVAVFFLLTLFDQIATPLLEEQGINIYGIGMFTGIIFFLSHHYSFYLYLQQINGFDLTIQAQSLQSRLDAQARQNRLIEESQKHAAEIRHEMKNLLFALQIELERENYQGTRTRIAGLLGDLKQYEQKSYTGIPVIDAMISWKREKLREAGSDLSVQAELSDIPGTLANDITSTLAIVLDNAADAVVPAGGAEEQPAAGTGCPLVRLIIRRWKNLIFIKAVNPFTRPLKYQDGELQSTKDETGHGLGLSALRRIIERYSGEIHVSGQEGVFSLDLMLMILPDSPSARTEEKRGH